MPAAKPKALWGRLSPVRLEISADHVQALLEITGADDEKEAALKLEIEAALLEYYGAEALVDDAPRAANTWAALSGLETPWKRFFSRLCELDPLTKALLREEGFSDAERQEFLRLADRLAAAVRSVQKNLEGAESRGRPKIDALRGLLQLLDRLFANYYVESGDSPSPQDYVKELRLDFVVEVLAATEDLTLVEDAQAALP